jgi:hypothetical protein
MRGIIGRSNTAPSSQDILSSNLNRKQKMSGCSQLLKRPDPKSETQSIAISIVLSFSFSRISVICHVIWAKISSIFPALSSVMPTSINSFGENVFTKIKLGNIINRDRRVCAKSLNESDLALSKFLIN